MRTIAIVVPFVWLAWLIATEWLPMFPLNDLRGDNVRDRVLASRTLKILAAEGHDMVIDVQHMVVGALSLIMLATTLVVTLTG